MPPLYKLFLPSHCVFSHMNLEPMPEQKIEEAMNSSDKPNFILLTSGEMIYAGSLTSIGEIADKLSEDYSLSDVFDAGKDVLDEEKYLVVKYDSVGYEYEIAIPYSDIADLISIPFSHDKEESDTPASPRSISPTRKAFYDRTLEVAEESDYPVHNVLLMYNLGSPSNFSWGEVEFSDDTALYCDWEYLQRRSGGVSSLGGGALGFSVSAGWEESLWSEFRDAVETNQVELDETKDHSEVAISGHIDFVTHENEYITKEMDGSKWIAGVISEEYVEEVSALEGMEWNIGFFKRESLMFPLETWEHIADPVTVYGNVIDSPIETGFGIVDHFIKMRAGAYLN